MAQPRSEGMTLLWLSLLFLLGVAVTCAVFVLFISGQDRGAAFYATMSVVCAVELVFFAYIAHLRLARAGVPTASRAVRIQVNVFILIWLVLAIIIGVIAADPARADTLTANKVFIIYLILTLIFLAATYALYTRSVEVRKIDRQLAEERRDIQLNVPDIEKVMRVVEDVGRQHAEHAVEADRVRKKLDSVRAKLDSVLVSARSLGSRGSEMLDWNMKLEEQIALLLSFSRSIPTAKTDKVQEILNQIAGQADTILNILRQRERSLMS